MSPYKKSLLVLLLCYLAAPLFLAGFNYTVDPFGQYRCKVPAEDLRQLAAGSNQVMELPLNIDDRTLLKQFLKTPLKPSVAVLGGSRVLNIQPEMFKMSEPGHFLNAGLTGATLGDYSGVWQLLKKEKNIPDVIILGLAPQDLLISRNTRWKEWEGCETLGSMQSATRYPWHEWIDKTKDLLAFATTLQSFKTLRQPSSNQKNRLIARKDYAWDLPAKTSAFSLVMAAQIEKPCLKEVLNKASLHGSGEVKDWRLPNAQDKQAFVILENLLEDIQAAHTKVFILLMPYHSASLSRLKEEPLAFENLNVAILHIKEIAAQHGVPLYDALLPEIPLFQEDDFFDGVHLTTPATYRLLTFAAKDWQASWLNEAIDWSVMVPAVIRERQAPC